MGSKNLTLLSLALALGCGLAWYKATPAVSFCSIYFFLLACYPILKSSFQITQAANHSPNQQTQKQAEEFPKKSFQKILLQIVILFICSVVSFFNTQIREQISSSTKVVFKQAPICVEVLVLEPAQEKQYQAFNYKAHSSTFGKLLIKAKANSSITEAGNMAYICGKLSSIQAIKNSKISPNFLRSQGIKHILQSAEILRIQNPNSLQASFLQRLYKFRDHFSTVHQSLLKPNEAAIMQRLLFGTANTAGLDLQTNLAIKNLGLSHVFAVSGMHLTAIILFLFFLLKPFRWPRWAKICLILVLVTFYSSLAAWTASITRSWALAVFVLLGQLTNKKAKLINIMLVAMAATLLIDPNSIGDIGFQLSYLATFGVILWTDKITNRLIFIPRSWAEPIAACLAAQILVFPIQIFYFQSVPIYMLPANLVGVPLTSLLLLSGLLTSFVSLFGSFGYLLASGLCWFNSLLIKALMFFISSMHALPASNLSVPRPSFAVIVIAYLIIGYFCLLKPILKNSQNQFKHFLLAVSLFMLALPFAKSPNSELQLRSFSHKTYEALLLQKNYGFPVGKKVIFICHTNNKYSPLDHLERLFQKQDLKRFDLWIGNCPKPKSVGVAQTIKNLNDTVPVGKDIEVELGDNGVLIKYYKLKALFLLRPVRLPQSNQESKHKQGFYSMIKIAFHHQDFDSTIWSDLPKAQIYFTPHASKPARAKLIAQLQASDNRVYDYQELKDKVFVTDGESLFESGE